MPRFEHGLDLPEEFTEIDRASIVVDVADQLLEIPLSPKQLQAVFTMLHVKIDKESIELSDDDELNDLEPDWVSVTRAAEMLGITRGRIYPIIRNGGLETRDDMGSATMVSVASIKERLANPPKPGRRWN